MINTYVYDNTCIDLVKQFEGLYLYAYRCASNVLTIGYGHTNNVQINQTITEQQANKLLIQDLDSALYYVNYYTGEYNFNKLNQNQVNALVSFTFNCGCGNLKKLLKSCNTVNEIPVKMQNYNKNVYGTVLSGLVKRRKKEIELFNSGGETLMFKTVKTGDKGICVTILQLLLNQTLATNLKLDGIFGKNTETYLKKYQQITGLVTDGICGQITWNSILHKSGFLK